MDSITERHDPYQLFLDSMKSPQTARKYRKALYWFLTAIPEKIYQDVLGEVPLQQESEKDAALAGLFVKLARKDAEIAGNIIAAFIKEKRKLVEEKKISPNTLPGHIKPIKVLLDANKVAIHWKSSYRLYPRASHSADDRAYTREEIQKMIEVAPDITDKLIIQMFSSGGFRLESWDYFTWKDVVFFKNKDNSYKGAALLVYSGDPESYWTFITPEACQTLALYSEKWKSDTGSNPKPDDPLLRAVKYPIVRRLSALGVKKRVDRIVRQTGLRPPLPPGKKRHEVPLDHGFRKYFNTMMRRAKVNYLDKEDMMGHSVGLEKHYERYQEEDFERFPEYQKAIPFLTISDEERLRIEAQQKQVEIEVLEEKNSEIMDLQRRVEEMEYGRDARDTRFIQESLRLQVKEEEEGGHGAQLIFKSIMYLWFEMSATEEEKRKIYRRLKEVLARGKKIDDPELLFGPKDGNLSLKNFNDG